MRIFESRLSRMLVVSLASLSLLETAFINCSGGFNSTGSGFNASLAQGSGAPMGQVAASRLLTQGGFGPSLQDLQTVSQMSYNDWFNSQVAAPASSMTVIQNGALSWDGNWFRNALTGKDQLRQRMAYALSQIFVVALDSNAFAIRQQGMSYYYNMLLNDSLGNFRTLLNDVSHSPGMGLYLTFYGNDKANPALNIHADENYARELMQLFTVGLWQLNLDGSRKLDGNGNPIPTYVQVDVTNMANVFTGWIGSVDGANGGFSVNLDAGNGPNYLTPMICVPAHHDTNAKTILNGVVIPAGGTCESDMKIALDTLFNHPNVGPFIGQQLIERLVTSNPSAGYISRVAAAFNNDGTGVRGNLLAVAKAVLTDPEAVNPTGPGKLREPYLRLANLYRAFNAVNASNTYDDSTVYGAQQFTLPVDYGQQPGNAPSVFNFYRPDYAPAGPISAAGLVAPEFQITNEFTIVTTINSLEGSAYNFIDSQGNKWSGDQGYSQSLNSEMAALRTQAWESLATNPTALVDQFNLVFMQNQMPADMRTTLIDYVSSISPQSRPTGANYLAFRVIEAASLIMGSAQYSVQQ